MDITTDWLLRPAVFAPFPSLVAAQSTRQGGVSPAPWHSLNLGKSTDDAPDNVAENRRRFCSALGFEVAQLAWSKQVHGDQIRLVNAPGGAEGYDALICATPGILLAVSVADCTPILIFDQANRVVAAVHAGWRGTVAGITAKTLQQMADRFHTRGADCFAYVGACISECAFEVGEEVAAAFSDEFKRFDPTTGKFLVDLKAANAAQCSDFGIPAAQIEISPFCTATHNDRFFSHRKEKGLTGRMLSAIGMQGG